MKFCSILIALFLFSTYPSAAQSNLQVQGTTPSLYLIHSVVPKENWYSIGRLYNVSPKEIASFNHTGMDRTLEIGQRLKIPLTETNFAQDNKKSSDESFVPVYYEVQPKEWMYRVSQNHNKVPIERLQQWNHITNGDIKAGMRVIVGYLKVKTALSALASSSSTTVKAESKKPEIKKPEENKVEEKKADESKVAETKAKEVPVKQQTQSEGFFKNLYSDGGKATSGSAGVFRSTSGWQDGKYYALMNNIPVGTIIKVENPSSGKIVYAKVLGNLPDMKESIGLAIRISDAAATELGLDAKAGVSISY